MLGVFIALGTGIYYSPVTGVRKVRVVGAPAADEDRLTRLLQGLRGVPCARVNAQHIETMVLRNPELRSASLTRTPFGSATLRVVRRSPVARLFGYPSIALSDEGTVYPATELDQKIPLIKLPDRMPPATLTLTHGWPARDVASLATMVASLPAKDPVRIDLDPQGRVCLNIDTGRVDLGFCDRMEAKIARLRETLKSRPDLFRTVLTVNLQTPEQPSYVPRPGNPNP